jgi:hypothetical protein
MAPADRAALSRARPSPDGRLKELNRWESSSVGGQAERSELLALADTRGLRDLGDAHSRVAAIADIFTSRADLRGVFPLIYRIGLDAVATAIVEGRVRAPDWVQTFEIAFASRYLDNLHRHLAEDKTTPPWTAVYRRVDDGTATITTTLAAALNAHLISDLPEALHRSDVRAHHILDYSALSRVIWRTAPDAIAAVKGCYGSDLSPWYRAQSRIWPVTGGSARVPSSQEQLFHSITGIAFARGCAMANPLARPLIRAQIASGSWTASGLVDQLIRLGQLS